MKPKKRVVIVDDSSLARTILREIIQADGDIEVVGEAQNGYEAVGLVDALKPDLVTMDIDMPGPSGIDTIGWIMEKAPTPILVITSEQLGGHSSLGFQAIQRGAMDFMPKPSISDEQAVAHLRRQVRTLSELPAFVHVSADDGEPAPATRVARATGIVAIASGVGGPRALSRVLRRLPRDFPCPVAIAQHMPPRFAVAFARYLESITPLPVRVVGEQPTPIAPGVFVCDSTSHLVVKSASDLVTVAAHKDYPSKPSADLLFGSSADHFGGSVIAVVLSGVGSDGSRGLGRVIDAGGLAVVERPETAIPADMPKAASRAWPDARTMPVELIGDLLSSVVTDASAKTTAPPADSSDRLAIADD